MQSNTRKIVIILFVLTQVALVAIWALNGYEDTWYYVTAMLITVSASWTHFKKKDDNKQE